MNKRARLLVACGLMATWSPAMAIEEPAYTVLRKSDAFELRRYEPYVVAETSVAAPADEAGNAGFRILADYIFGNNKGARRIEMTAPVAQEPARIAMTAPVSQAPAPGGYLVQFTMPREWTLATLPEPNDKRVVLRSVPARTVGVVRYSGTSSQDLYEAKLASLKEALGKEGLRWKGEPVWARYDPPWIPWFLRRNEIWLEID
jgi:hypothetical protein